MSDASATQSRFDRLPDAPGGCCVFALKVHRSRIGLVNAVIEGYDHMARVRTTDRERGVLRIMVPEERVDLFRTVVASLKEQAGLEILEGEAAHDE